jgi:PIN domain
MSVINHVFLDYENMKAISPALSAERVTSLTIFFGPQNRSLGLQAVKELLAGTRPVEVIEIQRAGKNAVDFTLAYYLGRKAVADPTAFFHIVSQDKGFDPMIEHLNGLQVKVRRHENYESLTAAMKSKATAVPTAAGATKTPSPVAPKRK